MLYILLKYKLKMKEIKYKTLQNYQEKISQGLMI